MKHLNSFTNKYSLSKTLRFELIPQGETLKNIEKDDLINLDEQLKKDYGKVKNIIDDYHREVIIEGALADVYLTELNAFSSLYYKTNKEETDLKKLDNIQTKLRKEVVKLFVAHPRFKTLFKKELITKDLPELLPSEEDKKLVAKFNRFTTYLKGFNDNRENVYTVDAITTSITNRLIHENLPKYLDNLKIFEKNIASYDIDFGEIEKELEEVLQGVTLKEVFTVEHFNQCLNQTGIDIYNILLGGLSPKVGKKIRGLNEYINLYRHENKLKARQCPNLKPLYKQILSNRSTASFVLDNIEDDAQLLESLKLFFNNFQSIELNGEKNRNLFIEFRRLFIDLADAHDVGVYLKNGQPLTDLSQKVFGNWSIIKEALEYYYENYVNIPKGKKISDAYLKQKGKWLKSPYFSFKVLKEALEMYLPYNDQLKEVYSDNVFSNYFSGMKTGEEDLIEQINDAYQQIEYLFTQDTLSKRTHEKKKETTKIKTFLDTIMNFYHFVKVLETKQVSVEKDEGFYAVYEQLMNELSEVIPLYNQTRNYLTKKENSIEKFKLNFGKGNLMDGFTESNGSTQYNGYLFRKNNEIEEYDYYLGISLNTKLFGRISEEVKQNDFSEYERLNYYQLKTTSFYGVSYKGFYGNAYKEDSKKLIDEILSFISGIDELNEYLKSVNLDNTTPNKLLNDLKVNYPNLLIDLLSNQKVKIEHDGLMKRLKNLFKEKYASKIPDSDYIYKTDYLLLNDLMEEIDKVASNKQFNYSNVSKLDFNEALSGERPLYLFKITNKDLKYSESYSKGMRKSRGKDNLHTMYFKQLMSGEQFVYDIGSAEMFYRPKSEALDYSEKIMKNGHHYDDEKMLKDKFNYPIIKNNRFLAPKFLFHLSIQQNYKCPSKINLNLLVREFLQNNPSVKIIGLDRGERNLLYLSLINQKGQIEKQFDLNEIVNEYKGKKHATNYHTLLNDKEVDRKHARENWGTIENIKDLKEGYLSQVVHKVVDLMVEHNAIVVMEDLNFGFKRGRQKVEKQIYQKFEKMLIDKLNYLVFKDKEANKPGGVLNALQLASKFESFAKMREQSGFIFYVPAFLTSKIDPVTGFVDQLRPRYESVEKAQEYFGQFDSIYFNTDKKWFEFSFDYKKFKGTTPMKKSKWTVCTTPHERYRWNKTLNLNKGGYDTFKVTEELELLFGEYNIAYGDGGNLVEQITAQTDKSFFSQLLKLLSVTASLRQNNGETGDREKDFILASVMDAERNFFNSEEGIDTLPKDADSNGAYHIALKGLWVLDQLNKSEKEDLRKVNLAIKNADWLDFAQSKPFLK